MNTWGTPEYRDSGSASPREQVGVSGALLMGTSSMDDDSFLFLPTGRDSNRAVKFKKCQVISSSEMSKSGQG